MKWKIGIGGAFLLLLLGAGTWIGFQHIRENGWERMLAGPYLGSAFAGEIRTNPISTIILDQGVSLESHQVADGNNGDNIAILLRTQNQFPAWTRLLDIQTRDTKDTNQVKQTYLKNVLFKRVTRTRQQYKVFITCDVGRDTNEGGIIYINRSFQFTGFSVSW